ncbi:DUF3649 domain-containing protein [Luteimonas sp. Y-2-2-4F]|nr:DUF3649 domain-containing protein [Luteimonas sp. Y-2-2-4F]MCD9032524.1 DUF3649 domain-containing protein [Luteimonas sp. Y-2-2-4F]
MSRAARAPAASLAAYRLGVLSRSLAALLGGYALAASASMLLALALPMPRAQATLTGILTGIALYAAAAVWAFAVRSAARAWLGIAAPAAAMWLLARWLGGAA